MATSGWCSGAPGARVPHEACRWDLCTCECHGSKGANPAHLRGIRAETWDNGGKTDEPPAAYLAVREPGVLDGYEGAAR